MKHLRLSWLYSALLCGAPAVAAYADSSGSDIVLDAPVLPDSELQELNGAAGIAALLTRPAIPDRNPITPTIASLADRLSDIAFRLQGVAGVQGSASSFSLISDLDKVCPGPNCAAK
jgi:hypothetical protein